MTGLTILHCSEQLELLLVTDSSCSQIERFQKEHGAQKDMDGDCPPASSSAAGPDCPAVEAALAEAAALAAAAPEQCNRGEAR